MDFGREAASLDLELGRCCHESVPERARLDALCGTSEAEEDARAGAAVDEADVVREANPVNSGMSLVGDSGVGASIAASGGIESMPLTLAGECSVLLPVLFAFVGLMDRARSVVPVLLLLHPGHHRTTQNLPCLRAALSSLPCDTSSSSFLNRSASSFSRLADNSRTDLRKAAGSKSSEEDIVTLAAGSLLTSPYHAERRDNC